MFNGNRLDWCLKWSTYCGKPAADAYCQSQGFREAVDFVPEPRIGAHTPTRLIGSGAICDLKSCDGFAQITCEKTPLTPITTSRSEISERNVSLVQKASLVAPLPPAKPLKFAANPVPPATPGTPPPLRKGEAYRVASASDSFDVSEPKAKAAQNEPIKLSSAPKTEVAKPSVAPVKVASVAAESKPAAEAKVVEVPKAKPSDDIAKPSEDEDEDSAKVKTDPVTTAAVDAPSTPVWTPAPKLFDKPMYNGKRLDWCKSWEKDCGQVAADAFCKSNGYSKATAFNQDPHIGDANPTRIMANGAVCDQALCNGFKDITCTM